MDTVPPIPSPPLILAQPMGRFLLSQFSDCGKGGSKGIRHCPQSHQKCEAGLELELKSSDGDGKTESEQTVSPPLQSYHKKQAGTAASV